MAIALILAPVLGLIGLHLGPVVPVLGACASSVRHSDRQPTSSVCGLFGSRTKGAMNSDVSLLPASAMLNGAGCDPSR